MIKALRLTAAAMLVLGVASALAAALLPNSCGIEGAYFDRSVGAPAYAGVFSVGDGLCWIPDVLVGAAAAFGICGVAVAVLAWRLSRRATS